MNVRVKVKERPVGLDTKDSSGIERGRHRGRNLHRSPVHGFRHDRAGQLFAVKVRNPAIRTPSCSTSASPIVSNTASTVPAADDLLSSHLLGQL